MKNLRAKFNLFPLTIFAIASACFISLSANLPPGDGGELIVTSAKLGILHPPGYPLYALLADLFLELPFSTPAWRLGLLSILCQLVSAIFIFLLGREWFKKDSIAAFVTALFCLAPMTMAQATTAEVFALNNLFVSLLLWLAYGVLEKGRSPLFAAFVFGLACAHHQTAMILGLPIALYVAWKKWRQIPGMIICFGLGLLPIFLILVLPGRHGLESWGDPANLNDVWTHFFRREYGTFRLTTTGDSGHFFEKLGIFSWQTAKSLLLVGLVPLAWGIFQIRGSRFGLLLLVSLIFYTGILTALSNLSPDHPLYIAVESRFWLLPLMVTALLAGWGLLQMPARFAKAVGVFIVCFIIAQIYFSKVPSTNFYEQEARATLSGVESGAILFCREELYCNALRYAQLEGFRADVHIIPYDLMWWPWMKQKIEKEIPGFRVPAQAMRFFNAGEGEFVPAQLLELNADTFAIYIPASLSDDEINSLKGSFDLASVGEVKRVYRRGKADLEGIQKASAAFLALQPPVNSPPESWQNYVANNYGEFQLVIAQDLIRFSDARLAWLLNAGAILKKAEAAQDKSSIEAVRELGLLYAVFTKSNPAFRPQAKDYLERALREPNSDLERNRLSKALQEL